MIKESFRIYNDHLIKILILSVMIVIPLTLFNYFATYYFYTNLQEDQYPAMYAFFLIVVNFTLLIPVFKKLAVSDLLDEDDVSIWELSYEFIRHFGLIMLVTIPLYIVGMLGSSLLFIPTFICFSIILLVPFFVNQDKIRDVFKKVGRVFRDENIFLLLDCLVIVCLQVLVWSLFSLSFESFENNFYVYAVSIAIINALIYPVLIFYLTMRYVNIDSESGRYL